MMPSRSKSNICWYRRTLIGVLWLTFLLSVSAQTRLTLQQAGSRTPPDWTPTYETQNVTVTGQVSVRPIWASDSYYVAIQDDAGYGLILQGNISQFQSMEPGDWVEVKGMIVRRGGRPVLLPADIRKFGHAAPPTPKIVKTADLSSFRYIGVLVTTESVVADSDDNAGGDLLLIGDRARDLSVFLPRTRRDTGPRLSGHRLGDRVQVTGIASQYCTLPPYDHYFQILVPSPASVITLERGWIIQPPVLLIALIVAGALLAIWWFRERRMATLRRQMRVLNALGEEVIAATSPAEILRRLTLTLPELWNSTGVGLYIQSRGAKILERVQSTDSPAEFIDLDAPKGGMASGVIACFRNRTLVAIPDARRSPFFRKEDGPASPRSVLFIPMFAQSDLMGVLALYNASSAHTYGQGEQAAMQHLANQVATALKLQEQQSIREQLFRSEKLAAAGQLISDVANELRSPLESIAALASALRSRQDRQSHNELQSIADEASRASEIVARLVSFAKVEQSQAERVDLSAMLSSLLKFRAPEWKVKGVEIRSQLAPKSAIVIGSPGQLEQVLLNLLVDAEKAAAEAREKVITVSTSLLAKRVLVELSYPTRSPELQIAEAIDGDHAGSEALGLGVCRGIIHGHGGEFRVVRVSPTQARFDIELPVIETRQTSSGSAQDFQGSGRQLTVLVVEPDTKVQRHLVQLLGNRGDRVVPVSSAEEGADLAQRLHFDMAICAVRLPGLNWVEFFERVRHQVGGFVLLTDGFDHDLARAFQGTEGFVLSKPIDENEVQRICRAVEERATVSN
jgi:signal transduction histidine kinase/ActR/RegA family two-component response regulator